ncbi:putative lyase [Helianthus annuus]|nr:putative lyase [Helianthus annuus]
MLIAVELIGRIEDDVVSVERERGPSATSVDAYMKTFRVSEIVAVQAVKEMVENSWKDINEGCLKPTEVPMDLLTPIVNLAQMTDVAYRYNDGFTFQKRRLKNILHYCFVFGPHVISSVCYKWL